MKKSSHPATRAKLRPRTRGVFRRFASLGRDMPEPPVSMEELRRRLWGMPSFFETLSPEALEWIRNGEEPEALGPPDSEFRPK